MKLRTNPQREQHPLYSLHQYWCLMKERNEYKRLCYQIALKCTYRVNGMCWVGCEAREFCEENGLQDGLVEVEDILV